MATFVIVPAVFSGGWTWKLVRVGLQAAGHEVYAVTLTGLGELLAPQIRCAYLVASSPRTEARAHAAF